MLILSRGKHEKIVIGDDILVEIIDINPRTGDVRIGIKAPDDVTILREEIVGRKKDDPPAK